MHVVSKPAGRSNDMHSTLNSLIASTREREIRAHQRTLARHGRRALRSDRLVLRRADATDGAAVARIAQLDGGKAPSSPALLAEVDGEVVAVAPIDGGRAFADPFRPTADVVSLLERRARQLRHAA
jgi:hypothetical protein